MMDVETPMFSVEDVASTLLTFEQQGLKEEVLDVVYDFASELTGLSADALNELIQKAISHTADSGNVMEAFGERVYPVMDTYKCNGAFALSLICDEGPFATLTVNIPDSPIEMSDTWAAVDTNNCPWAEEFIKKYGLGYHTGAYTQSGFCVYPIYAFDRAAIEKYQKGVNS